MYNTDILKNIFLFFCYIFKKFVIIFTGDIMNIQKLEKFKDYLINALLGIIVLLIYFILPYLEAPLLNILGIDPATMPDTLKYAYLIAFQVAIFALILITLRKDLKKNIKDLKSNHLTYFKKYFKYWLVALAIMMISNAIIMAISDSNTSGNEELIRDLFKINPTYVYISSVLIAPFVEELVFRKAIYNIIPNKYLFIIVSGLVFGSLHVIGNVDSWTDLLYLIPYCTPGFIFAYIMYKTDNVLVSSGLHFMHNGILMSLQIFVLIFS